MFYRLSLQSKIVLMFSTVIIIFVAVTISFEAFTFNDTVKKTYISQLEGITTSINGRYEESRSIEDVQQIFDYINHREEDILKLNLHVKKGHEHLVLASTERRLIGKKTPEILSATTIEGKTMVSHIEDNEQHIVRLVAPLLEDGMTIGAIELYIDNTKEFLVVKDRIISIAAVGITIGIIMLVALWIIIKHLLVLPLLTIREAATSIQKGNNYEALKLNASYELNEVAGAFNKMVFKLEDRYLKSITDPLTETYNSAYFKRKIQQHIEIADTNKQSVALLFCDIDNFKKLNDHEGHIYGDKVLKEIAQLIKTNVRSDDIVCRYGGEEFVVIMPNVDDQTAYIQAEKIRKIVALHGNKSILTPITISVGLARYPEDANEQDFIHLADQAMYIAKSLGKNRVVKVSELAELKKESYVRNTTENQASLLNTIISLTKAVEVKDSYTHSHSEMVSKYASILASSMGLEDEVVKRISIAGLLHDIGKIGIPDSILNKEGKLTDEELETMKTHPELGYNILEFVDELQDVLPYVLYHHERPDGQGYPKGLLGNEIPLGAKIISVVDAFHSMTSARPYRKQPLTVPLAIKQLENGKGTQFDEEVVNHFLSIINEILQHSSKTNVG
jgi:diguanylate cyclase (GGDEF)-like protein/putative nucleotidyltransferase with HDIG domain